MNKELDKISPRLQRIVLKLLRYNFKIKYIPGKDLLIADALLRAYLEGAEEDDVIKYAINSVTNNILCMPDAKKILYKQTTIEDDVLSKVKKYLNTNWPTKLTRDLKLFHKVKDELNLTDELLFLNHTIKVT